jgi:hypothetical protein
LKCQQESIPSNVVSSTTSFSSSSKSPHRHFIPPSLNTADMNESPQQLTNTNGLMKEILRGNLHLKYITPTTNHNICIAQKGTMLAGLVKTTRDKNLKACQWYPPQTCLFQSLILLQSSIMGNLLGICEAKLSPPRAITHQVE